MARHDHIYMRAFGKASESFTSPDRAFTDRPTDMQNRREHARQLRASLVDIARDLPRLSEAQERYGVPEASRGLAVTITARPGQPLDIGAGRVDSKDRALLGVRRRWPTSEAGNTQREEARVFLTARGFDKLQINLQNYGVWHRGSSGRRPDNFWLFEGAQNFHASKIEDYWTDVDINLPRAKSEAEWEVWTRRSMDEPFTKAIKEIGLEIQGGVTSFIDVDVRTIVGTRREMERLIAESAAVVELRGASSFVARDTDLTPEQQPTAVRRVTRRIQAADDSSPLITLLDTGVNRLNPLLEASLPADRCYVARDGWNPYDSNGHGTKMAGVALFGDLATVLSSRGPVHLAIGLESVTVSSPGDPQKLPAREALARAIAIVEADPRPRVYCLAATAVGEAEDGRPTSTSATLDVIAFNDGEATRLVCTAVGNVPTSAAEPYRVSHYATNNEDHGIQSPAQALNALSVGAATNKCSATNLVAPLGGLAPTSRTAQAWEVTHPRKPDIVMEGGNHFIAVGGRTSIPHVPDMVTTTSRNVALRPITVTGETSAATAAAARLAALTRARYPQMRAETIRALMVNSARWTPAMQENRNSLVAGRSTSRQATEQVLKCFGWGIPDEERLFWSADDALTLIVEDTLRPYQLENGYIRLNEMKSFHLPWPDAALEVLGAAPVELRCTLSYFVEPDPNEFARGHVELYASHRLKFDLRRYGENVEQALARFNRDVNAEPMEADDAGWLLGLRPRSRGSLHQDVWTGRAYQLRERNLLMVAPNRGWWGGRRSMMRHKRDVHFSLVVTITSPEVTADLYTEVRNQVQISAGIATAQIS